MSFKRATSIAALSVAIMLAACVSPPTAPSVPPANRSGIEIHSSGRDIYVNNCAVCHGDHGQGQPNWDQPNADGTLLAPPLNGDGHTWHHPDGALYQTVSQGGSRPQSNMPAFGPQLSEPDIIKVIEYVKSTWADKQRSNLDISSAQAQASLQRPYPNGTTPQRTSATTSPSPSATIPAADPRLAFSTPPVPSNVPEGRSPSIPFTVKTLEGETLNLADTLGTPTLLAFWAPW